MPFISKPRYAFWPIRNPKIDVLGNYEASPIFCNEPIFIIDLLDNKVYDGMKVWFKDMFCREVERYEMGEHVGNWTGYSVKFK